MPVRYLCNKNGKRKIEATVIVFDDSKIKTTKEVQLAKLQEMGIDAIRILDTIPKAKVFGISFDEPNRK